MPRRVVAINALLAVVAAGLAGFVTWEALRPAPAPTPARQAPASPAAPEVAASAQEVPATPGAYGIIASRNLFSPTRSDAPASASTGGGAAVAQVPRPNLYGVVLRDGAPIAYLEDPVTKRVAGYRIGDAVAGGTLKSIDADRVVLARPEGNVDVRLHDPTRPRPAVPQAQPQPAAGAAQPQAPQVPGLIPPVSPPQPAGPMPPQAQVPTAPGVPAPQVVTPGRRPLPPNLLRRFQQNVPGNAPTR